MPRRRPALTAAFAVVLLVAGQLSALAHEAETRHVECLEHGGSLEAVQLAGADDGCEQQHWIAVDGDSGGEHDDCEILRTLQQASDAPALSGLAVLPPGEVDRTAAIPPRAPLAAAALYRIAPKTSPPSHAG